MADHEPRPTPRFLAHKHGDHVAVAVTDLTPGTARGTVIADGAPLSVDVTESIPLGHKIALVDIPEGAEVIEYGARIGIASAPISVGQYVHTHNVRSARWQHSVAN